MSSKFVLELRHRPKLSDDIKERHKRFVDLQSEVGAPWGIPCDGSVTPLDMSGELSSIVDLDGVLGLGLKGDIIYQFRGEEYLRDIAQYDDSLAIEFNPKKIDYVNLVKNVFPILVKAFECYRATIYEKKIARSDWREIVKLSRSTGKDVNGRDGVYRVNAVNFYDNELCRRAFGLSPDQVIHRLRGKVEHVSLLLDGVLLIISSAILENDKLANIDSEVKTMLANP